MSRYVDSPVRGPLASVSTRTNTKPVRAARRRRALLAASVLACASGGTRAADASWNGAGASNSWSVGLNWVSSSAPSPGDFLFFDGAAAPTPFNDLVAGTQFNAITFNPGATTFSVGGNAITLGFSGTMFGTGNGITNASP